MNLTEQGRFDPDVSVACDGELLWRWRAMEQGITQAAAAEEVGTSQTTIGKVERGESAVLFETAEKLARGAGISLSKFVLGPNASPAGVPADWIQSGVAKGPQIGELRRRRGYHSQEDAARRTDLSTHVWSSAERSERLRWPSFRAIADVLDVEISEIAEAKERGQRFQLRDEKGHRLD